MVADQEEEIPISPTQTYNRWVFGISEGIHSVAKYEYIGSAGRDDDVHLWLLIVFLLLTNIIVVNGG